MQRRNLFRYIEYSECLLENYRLTITSLKALDQTICHSVEDCRTSRITPTAVDDTHPPSLLVTNCKVTRQPPAEWRCGLCTAPLHTVHDCLRCYEHGLPMGGSTCNSSNSLTGDFHLLRQIHVHLCYFRYSKVVYSCLI